MQILTTEIVKDLLIAGNAQPAVTIYAPMHTTASPAHVSNNQLRIKNLITQAASQVSKQYGEDNRLIKELTEWLDAYHDDLGFWERQTAGLLLCARPGDIQWFNLPIDTDEYIAVDETLHLAPVLAMLTENRDYYVLMVNQHNPKLFTGDMYQLRMSDISLPASLEASLNIDENNQKSENQGSANGNSMQTGWFNGRGGGKNPQEEDRMKFFRIVDHIVCNKAKDATPLILAGTDSEIAEYRELSRYQPILSGTINGSHSDLDMDSLQQRTAAIIKKELVQPIHKETLDDYNHMAGANPSRTAQGTEAVESAIAEGRVDKLLAPISSQTTDTIRDNLDSVQKITLPQGDTGKRLNHLALKVWQMSGTIVSLTPQEMPGGATMVARLRY